MASQIFNALSSVEDNPNQESFWTTVEDGGFLWFEEYPRPGYHHSHVLNGHISGIFGAYSWFQMSGSSSARDLVRASIYTVENYLPEYRVKGGINRYDLISAVPDYGPKRTLLQVKSLYEITKDDFFKKYFKLLASDMQEYSQGVYI